MDVRNCKSCKRLFNYLAGPVLCQACREKLEEKFHEVKEYVRGNDMATIAVVSEACDVSIKQLKQWVREERLVFSNEEGSGITCENCGRPISTGRFCQSCKGKLQSSLTSAIQKEPKKKVERDIKEKEKMRFLK